MGSDSAKQKQEIREKVTRLLLENRIAIPDPVFHLSLDHYIADFEDSYQATQRLIHLPEWQRSHRIFVTPDRSTQLARETAIKEGKEIVVTTYGICRGAVLLTRDLVPEGQEAFAATLDGMERFARPLTKVRDIQEAGKIDAMLTGALAISRAHGGRTGKGAGWFDAEWIMWRKMGLTHPDTPVIGIVHDVQVVNDTFSLAPWDALVGTIVTPTRVLKTPQRQQPEEIYWEVITPDWLNAIPIMVELYKQENPAP
ncbi:hypothetical protein A2115_00260 [Candidatus Woesebacteria bacterium GWA1_41_8]|uniref:5-formyltetrahydrofolate cyclo-ligase n=1 Tax=Candidatus Woesebacteria bacterium GWA1_41_8 TaxID=1802471 RepID=A0A1F7WIC9_9BACT|nr:MAG: hypothetical protein A2115_00260 [Candidatus Woesebacteria bacterium GWA1_41_8]